jgi:integrase
MKYKIEEILIPNILTIKLDVRRNWWAHIVQPGQHNRVERLGTQDRAEAMKLALECYNALSEDRTVSIKVATETAFDMLRPQLSLGSMELTLHWWVKFLREVGFSQTKPIGYIDSKHVDKFLNSTEAQRRWSLTTRKSALSAIHRVYNAMVVERAASHDPTDKVKLKWDQAPIKKLTKTERRGLTEDEVTAFLEALTCKHCHAAATLTIETGLRSCDVTSLEWDGIDLTKGRIVSFQRKVGRALVRVMTPAARKALEWERTFNREDGYVFPSFLRHTEHYSNAVSAAMRKAGIEGGTTHWLRYTHAARMWRDAAASGVTPAMALSAAAKALGHSGTHTINTYLPYGAGVNYQTE